MLESLCAESWELLDRQYAEHKPVAVYLMFSGGHDSLTASHVGATWARGRGINFSAAHINTGIGIEQTREFVRETCAEQGWPLLELHADREEQTFEYIVRKYGFSGPGGHPFMYRRLKERKIERLVREAKEAHPRTARVMLVNGMRRQESVRRMLHADFQRRVWAQVWIAPLEHWSKADCNAYIAKHELRRNEVVDLLHMSGECLCGSFAQIDEMRDIETWFPADAERIHELERMAEREGHASCIWGYAARHTNKVNQAQGHLFSPLCVGCEARAV